ncbi:hypothetical protein CASFOL_019760 [Castilleja foliolosa]|uniref:Uncharacterized protein n=1 Tax=Castilleja foliolosa TaxID=1961234 RepID=A0ABD3CYX2_9LAMI
MKMIKAMKKLKFWPRIKKRKKNLLLTKSPPRPPPSRPAPPRPYYPIHSQYEPLLPSAPPLPPWLEYDMQFQETQSITPSDVDHDDNSIASKPHLSPPRDQETRSREILCNQEYIVYEESVVPQLMKLEKGNGAFGCVVGFGAHLVRCVFPCFHVREEVCLNSLK